MKDIKELLVNESGIEDVEKRLKGMNVSDCVIDAFKSRFNSAYDKVDANSLANIIGNIYIDLKNKNII